MRKSLVIYNKIKHSNPAVYDKLSFLCIYLFIYLFIYLLFIYFHNDELDNNIYIFKSLLLCLWVLKLCLANTCKLKMVMSFGILPYTVNSPPKTITGGGELKVKP